MKRTKIKWAATAICSVSVLVLCASVGNAGIIPWAWHVVFGSHCPKNRSCPAPAYAPSPCGPSGRDIQSSFFAPTSCSPCGTSICSVQGGQWGNYNSLGAPSGQCGVLSPATPQRTTEPAEKQTYDEPGTKTDEGWEAKDGGGAPKADGELEEVEANKPVEKTTVPKIDAAPTPDLEGDADEKEGSLGPAFKLDEKITWRPTIGRKRLARRATYASARLIRKPRHAKGHWIGVPSPANVAKR